MKGLVYIPDQKKLQKAYEALQFEQVAVTEDDLALWSQWCRFDPRLAELMVVFFEKQWKMMAPVVLNECLQQQPWPAALGVLLEQVSVKGSVFRSWKHLVMAHVMPATGEQFFIGLNQMGGPLMREDAVYSHKSYKKWGYLGREIFKNKAAQRVGKQTNLDAATRRQLLYEYLQKNVRITVKEYCHVLQNFVSQRQAELDLINCKYLQPRGKTKGRYYVRIRKP